MDWLKESVEILAGTPVVGYLPDTLAATEPTALSALALTASRRFQAADVALQWLVDQQAPDGSLSIDGAGDSPRWPTGWAVLAWHAALDAKQALGETHAQRPNDSVVASRQIAIDRAVSWILATAGTTFSNAGVLGHDTTLRGWAWVADTHSWVEPTAIQVLALKATGNGQHERCREAVRLLLDRMLPSGGWNYGNTRVLGNTLRPVVQSTGLALAALAGEPDALQRVRPSLDYLRGELSGQTTTASLAYALLGGAAFGLQFDNAQRWLAAACQRTLARDRSAYKLALAVLAANPAKSGLFAEKEIISS